MKEKGLKEQAVSSGHIRNGKQVFYPYQWLIRKDGSIEQLLFDNEIGWQAANWEINCKSIAIVFDNDYENSVPSDIELKSAALLIREKYPQVKKENIIGHCEVNIKTTCPSNLFLPQDNRKGWKQDLIQFYSSL